LRFNICTAPGLILPARKFVQLYYGHIVAIRGGALIISFYVVLVFNAQLMKKMSPTSLKVTLEQIRRGKDLNLGDCLKMVRFLS
jgi:hypothetical protein